VVSDAPNPFEQRFLDALDRHLQGWEDKISRDFSALNLKAEVDALRGDKVYHDLGFDTPEYALVRLVGRMSISVGRRLGEIYDKVPRFVAAARFGLQPAQIAEVFDGLELDISLRGRLLNSADRAHIEGLIAKMSPVGCSGIGIEIRYNFNPNDSSRLRKDVEVASKLKAAGLFPVYLIFSSISPRNDAIARLTRGGWYFLQGESALSFLNELLGVDINSVLSDPVIAERTRARTNELMQSIFNSDAFRSLGLHS
jgi:hypothetical protein